MPSGFVRRSTHTVPADSGLVSSVTLAVVPVDADTVPATVEVAPAAVRQVHSAVGAAKPVPVTAIVRTAPESTCPGATPSSTGGAALVTVKPRSSRPTVPSGFTTMTSYTPTGSPGGTCAVRRVASTKPTERSGVATVEADGSSGFR